MGKRELLLIVCFVIVGVVVYQATAPPAGPNDRGFSFSRLIDAARREVRGNRASAELTTTADASRHRPRSPRSGSPGSSPRSRSPARTAPTSKVTLRHSNAYDEAEAKQYAEQTVLKPTAPASA